MEKNEEELDIEQAEIEQNESKKQETQKTEVKRLEKKKIEIMKPKLIVLSSALALIVAILIIVICVANGSKDPCQHRDADDNNLCDECGEAYTDETDIPVTSECQHRDADDNNLCDKCGEAYTDGSDAPADPACQHRDADDNNLCDKCGEAYTDETDIPETPECQHRDADDNDLCDECGEAYSDGTDVISPGYSVGLEYVLNIDEKSYSVNGIGTCADTNLIIPSTHDDLPVTSISDRAFDYCVNLKSVTIPDSIASIGNYAFYNCLNLTDVKIGDGVMSIGYCTFDSCTKLSNVYFGKNSTLKTIAWEAFDKCTALTAIIVPGSVTGIGDMAFYDCSNLLSVYYMGTQAEWEKIYISGYSNAEIKNADRYYYSETEPTVSGKYWHYNGNEIVIWPTYSGGLEYALSDDGAYYIVVGIGTCADTHISIPKTYNGLPVASIEEYALSSEYFSSVTIPDSIISIGEGAFCDCINLTDITISASVRFIGDYQFMDSYNLKNISVDNNNAYYSSIDGNLYTKDGKTLIQYALGKKDTEFIVPDGVTEIGMYAFYYCQNIESVVLTDGVTVIAYAAFAECYNLTDVVFSDSVMFIGEEAFYDCTNLATITFSEKSNLLTIGESAFDAFDMCNGLVSIYIPAKVISIGTAAFSRDNIESIIVDDNNEYYQSIDSNLYTKDGKTLIQYAIGKKDTSFIIPDGVTSIGDCAFFGCDRLISVTISNGVKNIGYCAFEKCHNLTSITIPASVESIGYSAFEDCSLCVVYNYSSLVFEIGSTDNGLIASGANILVNNGVISYRDDSYEYILTDDNFLFRCKDDKYELIAYCGTNSTVTLPSDIDGNEYAIYQLRGVVNVIIPNGITSIGNEAFRYCHGLTSITIPSSVTSIGDSAFYHCYRLTSIIVDANNEKYKSIDGNFYTKDGKTLIQYAIGKKDTSFIIPDGVTSIGNSAFEYCYSLTSITIPDSVTSIGDSAFRYCDSLTTVIFAENSKLTSIGDYAFSNCDSLTSITIPSSVTSIGYSAFCYCDSLATVILEGNSKLTNIGDSAFSNCDSLTSITIPSSVTRIGNSAFSYCNSLTSITIPSSVTSIGYAAFYHCYNLTSIIVDVNNENYQSIDGNLYTKDGKTLIQYAIGKKDTSFIIPDGVTNIGNRAFSGCYSLTSITIPSSVTSIGDYAFYSCDSLTSITIPSSVTSIGWYAFYYCDSLTTVYYTGTESEWNAISIGSYNSYLTSAIRYYYSETEPTEDGNFWHYVDGEIVVW